MSSTSGSFVRLSSQYDNVHSITLPEAEDSINRSRVMFDESKWDDRPRSNSISQFSNGSNNGTKNQVLSQTIKQSTRSLHRFNTMTQPNSPSMLAAGGMNQSFFPINQSMYPPPITSKEPSNPLGEMLLAPPSMFDARDRATSAVDADVFRMLFSHPFHHSIDLSNSQIYNQSGTPSNHSSKPASQVGSHHGSSHPSNNTTMNINVPPSNLMDVGLVIDFDANPGVMPIYDEQVQPNDPTTSQSVCQTAQRTNVMLISRPFAWSLLYYVTLKQTLLMIGVITSFYQIGLLYAALYGLYLAFFTRVQHPDHQLVLFAIYFGFVVFKSIVLVACVCVRVRYRMLWVNQWSFRTRWSTLQRVHHVGQRVLTGLNLVFSLFMFINMAQTQEMLTSEEQIDRVMSAVVFTQLIVLFAHVVIAIGLTRYFEFRFISLLAPFVPISRTFNSSAREAMLARAHKDAIQKLPSKVFRTDLHDQTNKQSNNQLNNQPKQIVLEEVPCCSVCLTDFEDGDIIRELKCLHEFHRECIDLWLSKRLTCPLCVQGISRTPSHIKRTLQPRQEIQMSAQGEV